MAGARNQRGAVLPSPVVLLSVVAVALAAVAYFATRGGEPEEREITTASQGSDRVSDDASAATEEEEKAEEAEKEKVEKPKPVIQRDQVGVNVFNNTSTTGLASEVHARVAEAGWNALAADNWYGTIPATTVYYPEGMRAEARLLALDLGIQRVVPAVGEMSTDNLTLILTGALD